VHLLNLLTIPALTLVFLFPEIQNNQMGHCPRFGCLLCAYGFYNVFPDPMDPETCSVFELFFVNSFGLPFNSGTIFYFLLLIGLITWGLIYTEEMASRC